MGNENIEKLMAFMLEQQARFASKIGQLEDVLGQLEDVVVRLAKGTVDRVDNVDQRISALVDSQIRTEENVKKTDENLRSLIAVVDRYLSEGRNGNPKG